MWAVVRAGGMVSGASPAYGVGEMVQALRTSKSVVIMTLPGKGLGVAVEAAGKVGLGRDRVLLLEGRVEVSVLFCSPSPYFPPPPFNFYTGGGKWDGGLCVVVVVLVVGRDGYGGFVGGKPRATHRVVGGDHVDIVIVFNRR